MDNLPDPLELPISEKKMMEYPPLKEEDVLNWDASIDPAPQRLAGEIKITLKYAGRDIPMPADTN